LQRLKKHLTPAQIVELACVVGFWKIYNTMHDSVQISWKQGRTRDSAMSVYYVNASN
jgi:hypothetical protein